MDLCCNMHVLGFKSSTLACVCISECQGHVIILLKAMAILCSLAFIYLKRVFTWIRQNLCNVILYDFCCCCFFIIYYYWQFGMIPCIYSVGRLLCFHILLPWYWGLHILFKASVCTSSLMCDESLTDYIFFQHRWALLPLFTCTYSLQSHMN